MAKGALGTDPKSSKITWTRISDGTYKSSDGRTLRGQKTDPNKNPKYTTAQSTKANTQATTAPTPEQVQETKRREQYDNIINQAGGVQSNLLQKADARGDFNPQTMGIQQFNPGDFQQQFQGAYDSALNQFNRSAQPAFDKQKQDFDQMAAERGIDPTSQQYKEMYKARISDPQETARLNAMDTAYQTGMSAQNQAYLQNANTYTQNIGAQNQQFDQQSLQYQMPFQNLSFLSPYLQAQYGQQMGAQNQGYAQTNAAQSQQYAKELAALQQKYSLELQRNAPRGGGGGGGGALSLADQMALQNNQFYNNMVLAGAAQPPQQNPGVGNALVGGIANGVSTGIVAGLK